MTNNSDSIEVRKLPSIQRIADVPEGERVETGPIQFGDDWPGLFIRGNRAFYYAFRLAMQLGKVPVNSKIDVSLIKDLVELLLECNLNAKSVEDTKKLMGVI